MSPIDAYLDSLKELDRTLGIQIRHDIEDWRSRAWTFCSYPRDDTTAREYLIVRGKDRIEWYAHDRSSSRTHAGVVAFTNWGIVHVVSVADEAAADDADALRREFCQQMEREDAADAAEHAAADAVIAGWPDA